MARPPVHFLDTVLGDRVLIAQDISQVLFNPGAALVAAGTTRADALALTAHVNELGTVAAGSGAVLPAMAIGEMTIVANDGANVAQIYATGSNTIDGVAGATGVALPVGKRVAYYQLTATAVLSFPFAGTSGDVANALVAAGTTRADALALQGRINRVTTAAASTGVILPTMNIGDTTILFNDGANAIKVYAPGSVTIDAVAGATGVTLTNAKRCAYLMIAANTVISYQLGVISA
jgi:hypothetical protein